MVLSGKTAKALLNKGVLKPILLKISVMFALSINETCDLLSYVVAVHDIGKCHPRFQAKDRMFVEKLAEENMIPSKITSEFCKDFRHERYSYYVLKRILRITDHSELWEPILKAISLHHQGKYAKNIRYIDTNCKPEKWEMLQDELHRIIINEFNPPLHRIVECIDIDTASLLIMGIIILSDWISSDIEVVATENDVICDEVKIRGLMLQETKLNAETFCELWETFDRLTLRGVQEESENLGKKPSMFYLIEAPMGEGKSEAAIYLAVRQMMYYNLSGFYMALPTAATGNQMYHRINELFANHNLDGARLLHSTAWMVDEYTPNKPPNVEDRDEAQSWLAPLRRGLLSEYASGTIDQCMLSVMQVKYGVLRMLGLASKVLILDEIHAYDIYMQTIIERLLCWCHALKIPVVMLSATLPESKKRALFKAYGASFVSPKKHYPEITYIDENGLILSSKINRVHMHRSYEIEIKPIMKDFELIAELAINSVNTGGCVCVLLNTVGKAQDVYKHIKHNNDEINTKLFHARFPAGHRQTIENYCVSTYGKKSQNRPQKSILVCTQVMEQSIDVDFDAMITDIAPVDLLLQRMGRVHRFDDTYRPDDKMQAKITVLTDNNGYEQQKIYAPLILQRTEKILYDRYINTRLNTPDHISEIVEEVYRENPGDEAEYELWIKENFSNSQNIAIAKSVLLERPNPEYPMLCETELYFYGDEELSGHAKTRLGEGSTRVVLLDIKDYESLPENCDKHTAKELLLKSVSIRSSMLGEMPCECKTRKGLLRGVVIIPTINGVGRWGDNSIYNDEELGTLIGKEEM